MKFTKENRQSLVAIIGSLTLKQDSWNGGRLGTPINPYEVISLSIPQLEAEIAIVDKMLQKSKHVNKWTEEEAEVTDRQARQEAWRELFDLTIGWKVSNAERAKKAAKTRELRAEIEALKDATMTPEERLAKKEELLNELMGEEIEP